MTDTHAEIMVKGRVVQALEWKHMDGRTDGHDRIYYFFAKVVGKQAS